MRIGDWAKTAAQIFSSYERGTVDAGAPQRAVDQLGQWFGHLARNAVIHWSPNIADPISCSFCEADAVTDCIVCEDACCVAHAHISYRAEAICDECVRKVLEKQEKRGRRRRERPAQQKQPPAQPRPPQADLQQALMILGLQPGATWEQVQQAYKATVVANHPDRFTGTQKDQAEARLKNINAAYNVLKAHYQRAA